MSMEILPKEFTEAIPVLSALEDGGFEAYFVGGSVRDFILGKAIHDVDIATSAYPEEVKQIFPRTIDVGIEHGTVLALIGDEQYEITTFRTESTYQDFRRPDSVNFVRSLEEDLKRRDFTINALAMNQSGEIVDLFAGMIDLENRLIRAVGKPEERFNEDALRVMRGLRFSSQLNFEIEEDTFQAISDAAPLLTKISVERIRIEFIKLLLAEHRNRGLSAFISTNCYQFCPGLNGHEIMLEDLLLINNKRFESEAQAWLLVVYLLDLTPQDVKSWLKQWKLSNQLIKKVQSLLSGLLFRKENTWSNEELFILGSENALTVEASLKYINMATNLVETQEQFDLLPIKSIQDLTINGQQLLANSGKVAGPWLGQTIEKLKLAVLNHQVPNETTLLLLFANKIIQEEGW